MFTVYISRGRGGIRMSAPETFDSVDALKDALIAEGYKTYRFTKPCPFDSTNDIYREGSITTLTEADVQFCLSQGCEVTAYMRAYSLYAHTHYI